MTDFYNIKRLALVLSVQAEIEAMKAYNQQAVLLERDLIYGFGEFDQKARELQDLANKHDELL